MARRWRTNVNHLTPPHFPSPANTTNTTDEGHLRAGDAGHRQLHHGGGHGPLLRPTGMSYASMHTWLAGRQLLWLAKTCMAVTVGD